MSDCCNSEHPLPRNRSKRGFLQNLSRRDVLRASVAGAGLMALGPLSKVWTRPASAGPLAKTKRLIVVNAFGGNDTTNMFIPTSLTSYAERRGVIAIAPEDGENLNSGSGSTNKYVLHPAMPKLAALYRQGNVAAVQKVGYPQANLSHFESQEIFSRAVRDPSAAGIPHNGWIARFADDYAPTPMGAVSVGVGRPLDFVGGYTSPFLVRNLSSFRLLADSGNDRGITDAYLHRLETAKGIVANHAISGAGNDAKQALTQAHELADQVQNALANYETNVAWSDRTISRNMKDIATLIEGGFETRIFYTGRGGFDTHGDQGTGDGRHATILGELDDAIGDFAQDMKDRGIWNDCVVVLLTEFGRRNFVNGSDGTDHGHGFCELVIGGKVKGGVKGPDLTDDDLQERYLDYAVDFRTIYKEILEDHLGADANRVLPEQLEINDSIGLF